MIEQLDNTDIYLIAKLGLKHKTAQYWAFAFYSYMVTRLAWRPAGAPRLSRLPYLITWEEVETDEAQWSNVRGQKNAQRSD